MGVRALCDIDGEKRRGHDEDTRSDRPTVGRSRTRVD
jgi:hypothetical protein